MQMSCHWFYVSACLCDHETTTDFIDFITIPCLTCFLKRVLYTREFSRWEDGNMFKNNDNWVNMRKHFPPRTCDLIGPVPFFSFMHHFWHSRRVGKRFWLPAQPPYTKGRQSPTPGWKYYRSTYSEQPPSTMASRQRSAARPGAHGRTDGQGLVRLRALRGSSDGR